MARHKTTRHRLPVKQLAILGTSILRFVMRTHVDRLGVNMETIIAHAQEVGHRPRPAVLYAHVLAGEL